MSTRTLRLIDAAAVVAVAVVVLVATHPTDVFSTSLITGGDTGAHVQAAAYLRHVGLGNLTPWFPGWFDGMPLYTYYFVLPDASAVALSYLLPFTVAFKLMTLAGSLLMPLGAYVMGRLMQAPRPVPLALAMATLPFLFDASFTIDGGNLFSTMAGEYAFSLSLALALIALGLFARGMRTSRGYWLAGLALGATLLSHLLPFFFALAMIAVLLVFEFVARMCSGAREDLARPLRFTIGAGVISFGTVAWWLLPFGTLQNFTNSMGYVNDSVSTMHAIATQLGWFNASGGPSGDRWVLVLAAVSFVAAWWSRQRVGQFLAVWCVLAAAAYIGDPQSVIWNERLVPFWFLGVHLLAGWGVGYFVWLFAQREARVRQRRSDEALALLEDGDIAEARAQAHSWLASEHLATLIGSSALVLVLGLASVVPGQIPAMSSALHLAQGGNTVSSWAAFNYAGYQGQAAWPEYHSLMTTMAQVGQRYGCGQAMWEYDSTENRFGTPEALMLLPYWTNNCIGSMEGLFFESSATTPYHFLDQAELSANPSDPQVGLNYGPLDVARGVAHLQMLGVRYYIAFSSQAVAQANADRSLTLVAQTTLFASSGTRWSIYRIATSPVVSPLTYQPRVVPGLTSRVAWLAANEQWWLHPASWFATPQGTPLVTEGPSSFYRGAGAPAKEPAVQVRHVVQSGAGISFDVSRTGVPVMVKVSYFPRWHVRGALGPYRASPNLMIVVPTQTHVTLHYEETAPQRLGGSITAFTLASGLGVVVVVIRRRWATRR